MKHHITFWVEIPVELDVEYYPAEKPDYSEKSPCPGSPESWDLVRVDLPEMPTTGRGKEQWLERYIPNLNERISEEIAKQRGEECTNS